MQQYMKNPPSYEVIHFSGGRENGAEIVKLMNERGLTARWIEEVRPTEDGTATVEEILFNNQSFPLNTWVVFEADSRRPELYSAEEFAHRFTPVQEFNVEYSSDQESLTELSNGVIDEVSIEKFEFDGLFSLGGVLHGRRADNGDFVPVVVRDDAPTLIETNTDEVAKDVEYDEVTASKVIEIIVEHIPTMSIRKATDLVKAFKHAGVLV